MNDLPVWAINPDPMAKALVDRLPWSEEAKTNFLGVDAVLCRIEQRILREQTQKNEHRDSTTTT